jgi:excisionase family DNA binding protein
VTTLNDFLTAAEAATALGLHQQTIKRFCRIGKLQSYKVNSGWLIPKKEIESFASTYSETRGRPANGRVQRNGDSGSSNSKI